MSEKLVESLDQQLANLSVLYQKLHHYHWYIKGNHFFTLHEKFQEDYEELAEQVDEVAERILMIGGKPTSTLQGYLSKASIKEGQVVSTDTIKEVVPTLISDYKQLVKELKETIELADDAGDTVTEDLLIGISASYEKKIWLYQAFQG